MSLLFFDGFETEGTFTYKQTEQWDNLQPSWANGWRTQLIRDAGTKRTGTAGMRFYRSTYGGQSPYVGCWMRKRFGTDNTTNTLIIGFGFRFDNWNANYGNFAYISNQASTGQFILRLTSDQKLQLINNSGTILGTGNYNLGSNTWYYIQMRAIADSTTGEIIVKLGSQTDISYSGNTSVANNVLDYFLLQVGSSVWDVWGNPTVNMYFDDIYAVNMDGIPPNDFIGVCGVYGALPSAIGDRNDFENYGGTNPVTLISEGTSDTGTYIYGDGLNEKALFEFSDFTTMSGGIIKGVQITAYVARSASGEGASKYRLVLRDSTDVEFESPDTTLADSNQYNKFYLYSKNPITDSTQDNTSINLLQYGIKVTQVD